MAKLTINTGTSNDAGNGDSLRTAFTKINDNFTELYTLTGNNSTAAIKDIKGSVFGDDSTTLVDSVASSINLEGTVKGNIIPDTTEAYDIGSSSKRFKDLYLKGNTITLGSQTISSTASGISTSGTLTATAVTTTAPSTLSGTFTGVVTGSVFADDSTPLIDGVGGKIVGNIENGLVNTNTVETSVVTNPPGSPQLTIDGMDSSITIRNSNAGNPGAGVGSCIEITSQDNDVAIRGEAYVSIISGSPAGPFADLDIKGNVITLGDGTAPGGAIYLGQGSNVDFVRAGSAHSFELPIYADASARDAAITSPSGGMIVYITATGKFTGYNGQTTTWDDLN